MSTQAHGPRPCCRCHQVKLAEEFPWGPGKGQGAFRRRRGVCQACLDAEAAEKAARAAARRRTWEQDGVLVRLCTDCGEVKPLTDYHAARANASRPSDFQYHCKPCQSARICDIKRWMRQTPEGRAKIAEHHAKWRERNPEANRELQRAYRRRVMADPVRAAAARETKRIEHRLRRERKGANLDEIRQINVGLAERRDARLPAAPLAAAVRDVATQRGQHLEEVCDAIGMSSKNVRAWETGERDLVQLTVADRVVTRLNLDWWLVWPDDDAAALAFAGEAPA